MPFTTRRFQEKVLETMEETDYFNMFHVSFDRTFSTREVDVISTGFDHLAKYARGNYMFRHIHDWPFDISDGDFSHPLPEVGRFFDHHDENRTLGPGANASNFYFAMHTGFWSWDPWANAPQLRRDIDWPQWRRILVFRFDAPISEPLRVGEAHREIMDDYQATYLINLNGRVADEAGYDSATWCGIILHALMHNLGWDHDGPCTASGDDGSFMGEIQRGTIARIGMP